MEINSFFSKTNNFEDFRPIFFRLNNSEDKLQLNQLISENKIQVFDTIKNQVAEFIRIKNPGQFFSAAELEALVTAHFNGMPTDEYGVWVYYPWSNKLVHLVDEETFITIRTNRNMYKISPKEQADLGTKKIGIIGLSVGQSIAITIATERICGELHLADFDTIELSNLNRLSVGVHELGTPKVVVAARRIAEIDPFIKVTCWTDGVTENNIDDFLLRNGAIDILAEESDGIQVKILSRIKAKALGIPVVMDTNDKGMIDIERFDIEKDRGIFHGRIPEIENLDAEALSKKLKNISMEEKFELLTKIIGYENISDEMKLSLTQMNKTIIGWPQTASAVTLGGAAVTDVCRRVLLKKNIPSGRYFIDLNTLIQ